MAGLRSHRAHQSRLDWWRMQIQRQPKTNLTIADFCRQLGVNVPTFYYWKRRIMSGFTVQDLGARRRPPNPFEPEPSAARTF